MQARLSPWHTTLFLWLLASSLAYGQGQLINGNRTIAGAFNFCTAGGTANALTCTLNPAITQYRPGTCFLVHVTATNTASATLNVNGLGATTLKKAVLGIQTNLAANDLGIDQLLEACYDGVNMQAQSLGGGSGSGSGTVASGGAATLAAYLSAGTTVSPTTALTVNATDVLTIKPQFTPVSGNTSLSAHYVIPCTAGATDKTLTLPPAATTTAGLYRVVKVDTGAGQCVAQPATGERLNGTINGTLAAVLVNDELEITLLNTGTPNWHAARRRLLVDLGTDVTGNLPVSRLNSGTNASASTVWCGNGTWCTPTGGGNVSNVPTPTSGQLALWTSATTIQGVTTLPATNFPAIIGDVTTSAGSLAATIANNAVTLAKMADLTSPTFLGRNTGGTGDPEALTPTTALTMLGGTTGTGALVRQVSPDLTTPAIASFVNAGHTHTNAAGGGTLAEAALALTDVTTNNASTSAHGFMPKGTGSTTTFYRSDGTQATPSGGGNVSNSGTPTSGQLALWTGSTTIQGLTALPAANFPALTGDVTTTAGSLATTIPAATVTLAKMANLATATFLGRNTAGTGVPEALSIATAQTMLAVAPLSATYVTTTSNATLSNEVVIATIAKAYVQLPVGAAKLPTTNPGVIDNSENNTRILFDDTTQECVWWQFVMPPDYGTSPQVRVLYSMLSASSGGVSVDISVMAVTPGDSADINTDSYATVNNCDDAAVPGTVGFLGQIVCPLTNNDSMSAGDLTKIKLCRAPADSADTSTGDLEIVGVMLEFTKQ
jgi:hypothetical protein